jgi:phage gp46-like protein
MNDYQIDPATRDYVLDGANLALCNDLSNRVYLALATEKGSLLGDADFGSELYKLKREKAVSRVLGFAQDACRQALQYLLDTGLAAAVSVETAWADGDASSRRMDIAIEVTAAGNQTFIFHHFVEVG